MTNFTHPFLLNAGGLFDFDLTFGAEGILFLLLAFVVTFVFLKPISAELASRAKFINSTISTASFFLGSGYLTSLNSVFLLTQEMSELLRQVKLTKEFTQATFETEIEMVQDFQNSFLKKLKGTMLMQSAYFMSKTNKQLKTLTANYFTKKYQSN